MPNTASKGFYWFSLLTLPVAIALVWWGAVVTTDDVGLAVPDWPLAYGKVNPDGWTQVPALLKEHGHRWIGGFVGVLVLIQYCWQFARYRPRFLEFTGLVLCGIGFLYLVWQGSLLVAGLILVMGAAWAAMSWFSQKWPLLRGLTVVALMLVILQASLGGLRVLKMSDPYGVTHGTLGQLFFCLLVLIAFASSDTWRHGRVMLNSRLSRSARLWSAGLFLAVFCQLILGAMVRHNQRTKLAAYDLVTTGGSWVPSFQNAELFLLFSHKAWGCVVAILVLYVAVQALNWFRDVPVLRWIAKLMLVVPGIQVVLGLMVIQSRQGFWFTNFHVVNGLALLVLSFLTMVVVWASYRSLGLVAESDEGTNDKPASLA